VHQGDNVAPVLFLFLMLDVSETMENNWKYKTPTCGHFKSDKWNMSRKWTIEEPELSDKNRSPGNVSPTIC
jgi:hypothetical protein